MARRLPQRLSKRLVEKRVREMIIIGRNKTQIQRAIGKQILDFFKIKVPNRKKMKEVI